jgi:ATP-dependent RNA helicase DDX58
LRCLRCDEFVVMADEIRKIKDSHHVIIDEDIVERCVIKPHPRPVVYDEFTKTGKIYCKQCNYDWGMLTAFLMFLQQIGFFYFYTQINVQFCI